MAELPAGFSLIDEPQSDTGSGPLVVTVAPNRRQRDIPALPEGFKLLDDTASAPAPAASTWDTVRNTAADIGQALPTGIIKGAIGIAGLPGDAARGISAASDAIYRRGAQFFGAEAPDLSAIQHNPVAEAIGSESLRKGFEAATGPLYEPQTTAGKYAQTVGEFIPGAGRSLANQLRYAVAPGLATEAAREATKGSWVEPYAAAGAGILAGGVASFIRQGKNPAAAPLAPTLRGVDDAVLSEARQIMEDGAQQGIRITWDEAIGKATEGATNFASLRRVVENSPEGAAVLKPLMAERPAQIDAAARQAFENIAPQSQAPSSLGPQLGREAESQIGQVRDRINTASEPFYTAAESVRLSPQDMARVRALPGFEEAANAVKSDKQLARYVAGLPEDSVGFLNEVKKQLDTSAKNAASPVNAQQNMQRSAGFGSDAAAVKQAAEAVSPDYAAALALQATAREKILQPILDGPLGKIASKDTTTKQAIEALFPAKPLAGSENEISAAMTALAKDKPGIAAQLVRAHAETLFNEATQKLASGPNQFGGAKFVAELRGNSQQSANLEAAVKALPNGADRYAGFNRFLDVVEATGYRPQQGSATAFNTELQAQMKRGSITGETVNALATGGVKLPGRITQWYQDLQAGKNAKGLAELLVNPDALPILRAIAKEPATSAKATYLAARLASIGAQTRNQ